MFHSEECYQDHFGLLVNYAEQTALLLPNQTFFSLSTEVQLYFSVSSKLQLESEVLFSP